MALWIEIHCDIKSEGPKDPSRLHPWCYSNNDNSPGILGRSDRRGTLAAIYSLEKTAIRDGWVKLVSGDWMCPNCKISR